MADLLVADENEAFNIKYKDPELKYVQGWSFY